VCVAVGVVVDIAVLTGVEVGVGSFTAAVGELVQAVVKIVISPAEINILK